LAITSSILLIIKLLFILLRYELLRRGANISTSTL
jgi:hypothetical protein